MEKVTIEMRSAEGGDDSKLLIRDMAGIYAKACKRRLKTTIPGSARAKPLD